VPLDDAVRLRTPEGISFSLPLAGPVSRFLACGIDLGCIAVLSNLAGTGLRILNLVSPDLATALTILAYFTISIGYGMATEWFWRGQTLGKRILHLRVIDAEGLRLAPAQILLRNLLRPVDLLPAFYFLGGVVVLASRRAQRLGDLAANTIVIRSAPAPQPDLDQLLAGKYNSLREAPRLAARLRQQVSPAEATLALSALLRRAELAAPARIELFTELAARFRALVPYPSELADPIGDEQYVRDVVDIIYRSPGRFSGVPDHGIASR
jgi:uncharacterized RDD family membrane protein YckC